MAARPIWRGHLKLSLVTCPLALLTATSEAGDIRLNMINPKTGNRVRQKLVDAGTGQEVERADLVRGYELVKGKYVLLTPAEIDELKVEGDDVMEIEKFVEAADIPPMFYEHSYYAALDGKAGADAFAVIREAMKRSGRVALARAVIMRRERVMALLPHERGMMAHSLHQASEVKDANDVIGAPPAGKPNADMLKIATQIIDRHTGKYRPADVEDRYQARLHDLIEAKAKGMKLVEPKAAPQAEVVDLMEALKRSLKGGAGAHPTRGATIHKLPVKAKTTKRAAAAGRPRGAVKKGPAA